jgi:hypothetical protein
MSTARRFPPSANLTACTCTFRGVGRRRVSYSHQKVRERDIVGNAVPENKDVPDKRLEELSETTIQEAESWDWSSVT